MRSRAKLLSVLVLCVASASAEQLYVEDKLVLNVYAEPDQSSGRIGTIQTGDAVEALERLDNFVRVQLSDGREGWVGASYLSSERPAILKLKDQQSLASDSASSKQHLDEIARLKRENSKLQTHIKELDEKLTAALAPPVVAAAAPAAHPDPEPEPVAQAAPLEPRPFVAWWIWILAIVITGIGGFAAGYQTLGKRVRARFGGVKVY